MMPSRKIIASAAMAAALTTGGLVGAVIGTPAITGAQQEPSSSAAEGTGAEGRHGPAFELRGMKLEAAAEAIGISVDDLKAALKEGKTIAQVAEANGVDRQTVIDALVAAGNEQLDELRATLPDRMAELVDRTLPERGEGHGRRGRLGHFDGEVAAQALGLTPDELKEQLRSGKSLADIATDQGVDRQTLIDTLVASATQKVNEAVANGKITQDRADEIIANLPERIAKLIDRTPRQRGN